MRLHIILLVTLMTMLIAGCVSSENTDAVQETVSSPQSTPTTTEATTTDVNTDAPAAVEAATEDTNLKPEILSSNSYINNGNFFVVGEIQNNLASNIQFVKIVATFYDESNNMMGSAFTYTDLDTLKAGQKSPFELSNYPDTYEPASYKLQASYDKTSSEPYNGLEIRSHKESEVFGNYGVIGEIANNGDRAVQYVKVVATFYDEQDKVIGKAFTYTQLDTIEPGSTSPFELSTYPQTITPARYELQVQCN